MGRTSVYLRLFLFLLLNPPLLALNRSDGGKWRWLFSNRKSKIQHPRIVGGTETNIQEFPFMVCLLMYYRHICGGTLIAETWVLTAAHCVADLDSFEYPIPTFPAYALQVTVGSTTCSNEFLYVDDVYSHPKFSSEENTFDICLLRIYKSVILSKTVQLVPLPQDVFAVPEGTKCVAIGWGSSKQMMHFSSESDLKMEDKLHKVTLPVYSNEKCQRVHFEVTNSQICTLEPNKDACVGDSGGPLMCDGVQQGITSYGKGCGDPFYPGVFERVDVHLEWLRWVLRQPRRKKRRGSASPLAPLPVLWLLGAALAAFALTP